MVDVRTPLTTRQVDVLRWVAAGCPEEGMRDASFKRTARTLQDRCLVRVSKRKDGWHADLTEAGNHYLEHGRYPGRQDHAGQDGATEPSRTRAAPASTRPPASSEVTAASTTPPPRRDGPPRPAPPAGDGTEITAEMVLARVREAGGELTLLGLDDEELMAWRRAAKVAQLRLLRAGRRRLNRWTVDGTIRLQLDLVPAADADDDELTHEEIEMLLRASAPPPVVPRTAEFLDRRVPVPSKVTNPHPVVDELTAAVEYPDKLRRERYGPFTSLAARRRPMVRMRRIWQAIVAEALYRGYSVRVDHNRRDYYDHGTLVVKIGPDEVPIRLNGDSTMPLRLSIPGERSTGRRRGEMWTDGDGRSIEGRLAEVFTTIERRAEDAIRQRADERRRADDRRRQWSEAMKRARRKFAEHHRRQVIEHRMADAAYADDVRAYAEALRARATELPERRRDKVTAWALWAARYADSIDSRTTREAMPTMPDPTAEQLKPFLRGWSPYGPY